MNSLKLPDEMPGNQCVAIAADSSVPTMAPASNPTIASGDWRISNTSSAPPAILAFLTTPAMEMSDYRSRSPLRVHFLERLAGDAEGVDAAGDAGIDRDLDQHLADLLLGDAVV